MGNNIPAHAGAMGPGPGGGGEDGQATRMRAGAWPPSTLAVSGEPAAEEVEGPGPGGLSWLWWGRRPRRGGGGRVGIPPPWNGIGRKTVLAVAIWQAISGSKIGDGGARVIARQRGRGEVVLEVRLLIGGN